MFAITDRWSVGGYLFCTRDELIVVERTGKRLSAEKRFSGADIDRVWRRDVKRGHWPSSIAAPLFAFAVSTSEGMDVFCMRQFACVELWRAGGKKELVTLGGPFKWVADDIEALVARLWAGSA